MPALPWSDRASFDESEYPSITSILRLGLSQATLHRGKLQHLIQDLDATLQVLQLLKQGNNVQIRHIFGMGKGELRQLIYIGNMLSAFRKRDNVTMGHLLAVTTLDRTDSTERIENLAGHRLQVSMNSVFADISQRALMDH